MKKHLLLIKISFIVCLFEGLCAAADWPMWRCDANRSDTSSQQLASTLYLQWSRQYPPLVPAWEDPVNQDRMGFDKVYEPVVAGQTMFIGSSRSDKLIALDTRTGAEKWSFYADGPIRFAPAVWKSRVYFVSDDGLLYCLNADDGTLVWKFRGSPSGRKILGNGRLVSAWPVRGGLVIKDGIIYFSAGIWPFMGVFIYAINTQTGRVVWQNDATGSNFIDQPHEGASAFAGLAPQGALAVVGDRLIVPGGRSVPACFDIKTGELRYYHLSGSKFYQTSGTVDAKREGGSHVCGIGKYYFNHRGINTSMYDVETGQMYFMWNMTTYPVLTEKVCYLSGNPIVAYDLAGLTKVSYQEQVTDRGTKETRSVEKSRWQMDKLWQLGVDGRFALIKAGERLYAGGDNIVSAVEISGANTPSVSWSAKVDGNASRLIAADDRLFVVTDKGWIYAFAAEENRAVILEPMVNAAPVSDSFQQNAKEIIASTGIDNGYCLVFGLEGGDLIEALLRNSNLYVIAVDPDEKKVAAIRRKFDAAGVYGTRVSVHAADAMTFDAPPYLAELIVSESPRYLAEDMDPKILEKVFYSTRPYGGTICFDSTDANVYDAFEKLVQKSNLPGAKLARSGKYTLLRRAGALAGSADWTHQYGDVANTAYSRDSLVKLPLGLLWFGGSSHHDVLPRHGHGPTEQVVGGRLFIEGVNMLSARDVYTGRVLWKREFPDLGTFGVYYDKTYNSDPLDTSYNQEHIPGSNARGTNYIVTPDKVYLVIGGDCLVLDVATGKTINTISLPREGESWKKTLWGYIGVYEDLLIAGTKADDSGTDLWNSKKIIVMDRHTGRVLWSRDARYCFRHNAIVAGTGKLFCIDALPEHVLKAKERRGLTAEGAPALLALDARSGQLLWAKRENVFGTWLGYSEKNDILLQCGRNSKDMLAGEPSERMMTCRGIDGEVIWDKPVEHSGPCMLTDDTIYLNAHTTQGSAVDLFTGEKKMRKHPLTGETIPWTYRRYYGCNSSLGTPNLLTFRSGAAGFYDLASDSGTGNFGGFKSGCTANLVAANGILNAPDYTRTCTCSYQNQTSLALVHMPETEIWTFNDLKEPSKNSRITRLGVNFGAPGDRMTNDGTLWLEWPYVGGPGPRVKITAQPADKNGSFTGEVFRRHSSRIKSGENAWITASGLKDVNSVEITLCPDASDECLYNVKLYFAEPDNLRAGRRIFDVSIQGKKVLEGFDIAKQAGGADRTVVKEFSGITVKDILKIELTPAAGTQTGAVLCGVEILAEKSSAERRL